MTTSEIEATTFLSIEEAQPADQCKCAHRYDRHHGNDLLCWEPNCQCYGFDLKMNIQSVRSIEGAD